MRVLVVDTYYPAFLRDVYSARPELAQLPYDVQHAELMAYGFGTGDSYSAHLIEAGHEGTEIVAQCSPLQAAWAREHGGLSVRRWGWTRRRRWGLSVPWPDRDSGWHTDVLERQIRAYRPDVLLVQDMNWMPASVLGRVREHVRLIVGHHGTAVHPDLCVRHYDLVLSQVPRTADWFRSNGIPAEWLPLAFDERHLSRLKPGPPKYDVVHVGGYGRMHRERTELLEQVASVRDIPVTFFGYGEQQLDPGSPILPRFRGPVWGVDMLQVRHDSRITLTKHIHSAAGTVTGNMTVFEATGSRSCLVVDAREDLHRFFEVGREVVAYRSPEECVEILRHLLGHEEQRAAIARAGQERTLRDHTYRQRIPEMLSTIEGAMGDSRRQLSRVG